MQKEVPLLSIATVLSIVLFGFIYKCHIRFTNMLTNLLFNLETISAYKFFADPNIKINIKIVVIMVLFPTAFHVV